VNGLGNLAAQALQDWHMTAVMLLVLAGEAALSILIQVAILVMLAVRDD